jgi:hypothetical protein
MPQPGFFILHSRVIPPLTAGDYTLAGKQEVSGGKTEPLETHIRIDSARFRMPPDQILSSFPPANAEGAFEARLPQIVLRRRTLPWERAVDADRNIPWMALVVIAEGEGTLSGESPVKDCVTPGVTLTGPNDVATGIYLTVTETVLKKVFPRKEELALLAHVREVDINDTELALGDDDGFLAVVLANRLPQYDRVNCKPVHYMACLVNLEGQVPVLPTPADDPVSIFDAMEFIQDVRLSTQNLNLTTDQVVMGQGFTVKPPAGPVALPMSGAVSAPPAAQPRTAPPSASAASSIGTMAQTWASKQQDINSLAVSAAPAEAGRMVRDAMTSGFRSAGIHYIAEKTYRFPVLAHWSFTCTGAGSFETLMQGLDVGLLGTLPADPAAKTKPDCAPPPKGDAPPPTKPPRPDAEVTETGHVGLPHLTRRGDALRAWYRGPLTLHVTQRDQPDAAGHLPMAHVSDQLRRITPDGREDVAQAAAFEIGRLLALSQPSVVSALIRWRREQFGAERARQIAAAAMGKLTAMSPALKGTIQDLGRLAGKQLVLAAANAPEKVLAPSRPLADPGRPLTYLPPNTDQVLADGFGFALDNVKKATTTYGIIAALHNTAVPQTETRFDTGAAAQLKAGLSAAVDEITANAIASPANAGVAILQETAVHGDALDELLAAAARKKEVK